MKHVIENAVMMLREAEWIPLTVVRVLIGIFFCISGGTKLFVQAQFGVLEQTMVKSPPFAACDCSVRLYS